MNENYIPKEAISEGLGEVFYLLPIPFIALVIGMSLWLGIIKLNGNVVKRYKLYNSLLAVSLAIIAYFTIPIDQLKVKDLPTLIISIIASGAFIEVFIFWRKRKSNK